jgi:negative regulator of sigma E activity
MSAHGADLEALLSRALAPVEPPASLTARVEAHLEQLAEAAVDELEGWELRAMRDPRNWLRPVVASTVAAGAGTALVVLRVRAGQRRRAQAARGPGDLAARTLRAAAGEARKLVRR